MNFFKLSACLVAFFTYSQANALSIYWSLIEQVCVEGLFEGKILLIGEYEQHEEIPAVAPDDPNFVNVYRIQYKVNDLWCGEVETNFEPVDGAPNYGEGIENDGEYIWVVLKTFNQMGWEAPEVGQRQIIVSHVEYSAFYSIPTNGFPPTNVDEDDMVTGYIGVFEPETQHLDEIYASIEDCAECGVTLSIDESPDELRIFPNPVASQIYFASLDQIGNRAYSIFAVNGQMVQHGISRNNSPIEVVGLKPGLYYLSLRNSTGTDSVSEFIKL